MVCSLTIKGMSKRVGNVLERRYGGLRKGILFQFWGNLIKIGGFSPCIEGGFSNLGGEKSTRNYISEEET